MKLFSAPSLSTAFLERTLGVLGATIGVCVTIGCMTPIEAVSALDLDAVLAAHSVTVSYTDDTDVNCGAASGNKGGCFRTETPDTIYVSPELTGRSFDYVVLHELAHVKQYRDGAELSDCDADKVARSWGASLEYSSYAQGCLGAQAAGN